MFATSNKPTPFKMDLKRATLANNSTAISTHHQSNQLNRDTAFQSKLHTTRQSLINSRQSIFDNRPSQSITNKQIKQGKLQRDSMIDTSQVACFINTEINNDDRLSKGDLKTQFRQQIYELNISSIVTGQARPIPAVILQKYQQAKQQKSSQNQQVNFCQGYLQKANIIYYAVEKQLFLYNGEQLTSYSNQHGIDYLPKKVVLKETLFKIYQVELKNSLIQRKMHNKILLFSYPYQIDFCTYQNSTRSSQIKLINLELAYALDTMKGQFFQSTFDSKIIYLDNNGKLNYLSPEQSKTLYFIGSGKYSLRNNMPSRFIKNQFWAQKEGFWKKTRQAFRKLTNYAASILPFKHQNCNLVYDEKRGMVFTLTSYTENKVMRVQKKIIKAYTYSDSDFIPIWSILEEQLIQEISSKNIFKNKKNPQIKDICKVDLTYNKGSNLLIVLSNSSRVFVDISQQKVRIIQTVHPPQFSALQSLNRQKTDNLNKFSSDAIQENANLNFQKQVKIHQKQSNQTELKQYYCKNNVFMMLAVHQKNIYSVFCLKQNGESQNQKLMNISWKQNMNNQVNLPVQNYFYRMDDSFQIQSDNSYLLSGDKSICESYQYLRQTFYPPRHYYYCNDRFIQKFFMLRPIDIMFSVVKNNSFYVCQTLIPKLFKNLPIKQICVMFIQIYTNQKGVYYESSSFNNSIDKIAKRQAAKNIKNSQIGYRVIDPPAKSMRQQGNKNIVKKVQFKQISRQMLGLIQKLFIQFSCKTMISDTNELDYFFSKVQIKSVKSFQDEQRNKSLLKNQFGSIILYISRLYHPLWNKLVQSINEDQNKSYLIKIKSLKKMNLLFKNTSTEQIIAQKIDGLFQKTVQLLNLISVIRNFPKITFYQCLDKDAKYFQQFIFKAIDKCYQTDILTKFQLLFPMYLNNHFRKIVKIYEELRPIQSHSKIIQLLRQQQCFPRYFIEYLINIRQIKQARILRVQGQSRAITSKLMIPGNMTPQAQIDFIFQQVRKSYRPINQKLYFLELAQEKIEQLMQNTKRSVTYSSKVIIQMKETHYQLLHCLKLQKLMKQEYQKLQSKSHLNNRSSFSFLPSALSWNQSQNSRESTFGLRERSQLASKLQNCTYTKQKIKLLLQKQDNPKLLIIYLSLFDFSHRYDDHLASEWEKLMINIKKKTLFEQDKHMDKFVAYIANIIRELIQTTKGKLNLGYLMQNIDKQFYTSSQYLTTLKSRNNGQCFMLGCYLAQLGCETQTILAYYFEILQEETVSQQKRDQIDKYFYVWFNCLQLIKKFSVFSTRKFVIVSQEYIKLMKESREQKYDTEISIMKLQIKRLQA